MNQSTVKRRERKISASRLRRFFADMAEDITDGVDNLTLSMSGNTVEIHLEGGSINITVNNRTEKGGNA